MKRKINKEDYGEGKDLVDLINEMEENDRKKEREILEKKRIKEECELVFEHHKQFQENNPWKQYHCNMFDEMPARLASVFSRYFAVPDADKAPYDYFLDFFKNLKTTKTRWDKLSSEFRLKNQYWDQPFHLKHMPIEGSAEYQVLAAKTIAIFVRGKEQKILEKIKEIDSKINGKKCCYSIEKKSLNEIIENIKIAEQKRSDVYVNFDPDKLYRSAAEVEAQRNADKRVEDAKFLKTLREGLPVFNSRILRKDPTEEQYHEYEIQRRKEKNKQSAERRKQKAILKEKEKVVALAREKLKCIIEPYFYFSEEEIYCPEPLFIEDFVGRIININNIDKLPEMFTKGKDVKEKISSLLDLENEEYADEINKELDRIPEIEENHTESINKGVKAFHSIGKPNFDENQKDFLLADQKYVDSKISIKKLKFKDEFNPYK